MNHIKEDKNEFLTTFAGESRRKFKMVLRNDKGNIKEYSEMNQKDRDFIRSCIDPTVNDESSIDDRIKVYTAMKNRIISSRPLVAEQMGWIIDKEIPNNKDIIYSSLAFGPCVDIIRPHVKEAIEQAKLTGGYFQPVWIKEIKDIDKPDYYTLNSTNGIEARVHRTIDNIAELVPLSIKQNLLDLNYTKYNPSGDEVSQVEPNLVSYRAYIVLKQFRKTNFGPVIFESDEEYEQYVKEQNIRRDAFEKEILEIKHKQKT